MSKQTPSQGTAESKKEPMPPPYTDVPNGMPVGVWMPGRYHNPDHMEWRDKKDKKVTKEVEERDAGIDIQLTDAHTWNSGTFGKRLKERQCLAESCKRWFTPSNGNQKMCSDRCRENRRLERLAARKEQAA